MEHSLQMERQEDLEDLGSQQDLVVRLGKGQEDPSSQVVLGGLRSQALPAALRIHEAPQLLAIRAAQVTQACLEKTLALPPS